MFGKSNNQKYIKREIPEFAKILMQWNIPKPIALQMGEEFANQALLETENVISQVVEDVNLATLYLSGDEPSTPFGQLYIPIIRKYKAQRDADAVTIDDFTWFWSMPLIQRNVIIQKSNAYRAGLTMLIAQSRNWVSEDEMWEKITHEVSRNTVSYGLISAGELVPTDATRPISFELFKRIETYRSRPFSAEAKQRLVMLDNQNAFMRQQLERGAF